MMNRGLDQEGLPESVTSEELVDAVKGRRPDLGRTAALKELLRRKSPRARRIIDDVLVDPATPLDLRTTAARALGKWPERRVEKTLIAALDAKEPALRARVAESLGRIGGREAFDALASVKAKPGTAHYRTIRFARSLIAYRLGLDDARLRRPAAGRLLKIGRRRAIGLKFETVRPNVFRAAEPYLKRELPGISVAERGSLRFRCRQENLWIVLNAEVQGAEATGTIAERGAVVAVLLKESHCPDTWYVYEYFLSHPRAAGKADVFGVRPTGSVSHFGEIDLDGPNASVRLHSLNTPRLPAIEFEAEYRGREGRLVVKKAVVATALLDRQRRPLEPRSQGLPKQ